jgi:hypothetical protein
LALEDAELVTEGEDLSAESGVGVSAEDQDLEQEADEGTGEGAQHDPRTSQQVLSRGKGEVGREVTGCGQRHRWLSGRILL